MTDDDHGHEADLYTYEVARVEHVFHVFRVDQYGEKIRSGPTLFEAVFPTWEEALAYRDQNTGVRPGSAGVQWLGANDSWHRFGTFQRRRVVATIKPKKAEALK